MMRFCFAFLFVLSLLGCAEPAANGARDLCSQLHCDDGDDCTEDVCDPTDTRFCLFFTAQENTPCNGGGVCDVAGDCVECNGDQDCEQGFNDCTRPSCKDKACGHTAISDGTECAGGACREGRCELTSLVVPCTEQGIRNAIAAGGGAYDVDCDGPMTVTTDAEIVIDKDLVLGADGDLTLNGGGDHRVFSVLEGATVWLDGISATGGFASENCGGLLNGGRLLLTQTVVLGNTATSGGGGICNTGTLTLLKSRVSINRAEACAGIFNNGVLTVENSTVSGNAAASGGGGICSSVMLTLTGSVVFANAADYAGGVENSGTLTMSNSTVSGNDSRGAASGLFNSGDATVTNSTLSGNAAGEDGEGIRNVGTLLIENTIVDGDCGGGIDAIRSNGYNIESLGDTCSFDSETDQVEVPTEELKLQPLANNGGPTITHALLPGSVAIDQIPVALCELDRDQRGVARPQGTMCDVGAFELGEGGP